MHHVNGKVDPAEDAETINFELALADVAQIEKRLERLKKGRAKTKEEQASNEVGSQSCHCIHVVISIWICIYTVSALRHHVSPPLQVISSGHHWWPAHRQLCAWASVP